MNETHESDPLRDRIDADVLAEYVDRLQKVMLTMTSRRAREEAGSDAPIEVFARHLIAAGAIDAAADACSHKAGTTDTAEIARWHRQLADALCIPTRVTTSFCPPLEPGTPRSTEPALRRWNAHFQVGLRDAGVYFRRGRHNGPHSYELCETGYGWTLIDHGEPVSDRERTEHLIHESAEALVRCANDMGGARKDAGTLRAELWQDAERDGNTDPGDGR